eukprot:3078506-Alexandrium_andersonii.AAC.1
MLQGVLDLLSFGPQGQPKLMCIEIHTHTLAAPGLIRNPLLARAVISSQAVPQTFRHRDAKLRTSPE